MSVKKMANKEIMYRKIKSKSSPRVEYKYILRRLCWFSVLEATSVFLYLRQWSVTTEPKR